MISTSADRQLSPDDSHFDVVIVGAGQAGLSMSHMLQAARHPPRRAREAPTSPTPGARERWDSFCLVTPNWQCQLPGHPYSGSDPDGFMLKHEIVAYLEDYVRSFRPPLLEGVGGGARRPRGSGDGSRGSRPRRRRAT